MSDLSFAGAASSEALRALAERLQHQAGAAAFYVFRYAGKSGGAGGARPRTLLACATPDLALAFAQRNGLIVPPERPQLRCLSLAQLLTVVVREPAIEALLLVRDQDVLPPPGQLPQGLRLSRDELMRQLREGH